MSNTTTRSKGCEICGQPFDQKNEALFQDRFHEGCLPDCTICGRPIGATSCAIVERDSAGWKAHHKQCAAVAAEFKVEPSRNAVGSG
jgi:hypothetical protein